MRISNLVFALLIAVVPASAFADGYQAFGTGRIVRNNTSAARKSALADAFAQALDQAVQKLLNGVPTNNKAVLSLRGRARRFIPRFKIVEEGARETVYQIMVSVEINEKLLANELRALGALPSARQAPAPGQKRLLLFSQYGTTSQTYSSVRSIAPSSLLAPTLYERLGEIGIVAESLPSFSQEPATVLGFSPPLTLEAARRRGSTYVLLVGVRQDADDSVRGVPLRAGQATAQATLLRVNDGQAVWAETWVLGAYGNSAREVERMLVARVVGKVVLEARRATRVGASNETGILVRLRSSPGWKPVETVRKRIAATRGVASVGLYSLRPGEVTLRVIGGGDGSAISSALARMTEFGVPPVVRSDQDSIVVDMPASMEPALDAS